MTGEAEEVSPDDFMMSIYDNLLDSGWTLPEIDEMDIFNYFRLLAYRKKNKKKPGSSRKGFIDEVLI